MKAVTPRAVPAAILLLLLLLCAQSVRAARVTFSWNPIAVTSYRLRLGTNSTSYFSTNVIAGSATNFSLSTLNPALTYYATLVAVTTNGVGVGPAGLEGDPSNEVQFVIPPAPVLRIESSIQSAPTPAGPWELLTNSPPLIVEADLIPNRFYRGILMLEKPRDSAISP